MLLFLEKKKKNILSKAISGLIFFIYVLQHKKNAVLKTQKHNFQKMGSVTGSLFAFRTMFQQLQIRSCVMLGFI